MRSRFLRGAFASTSFFMACSSVLAADRPVVSVVAMNPDASEAGPVNGILIVTREADSIEKPLVVRLKISGTATPGVDYKPLAQSITIPAHEAFVQLDVVPVADALAEESETVEVAVVAGDYEIGSDNLAEVTIADAAGDPAAGETSDALPGDLKGTLSVSMVFKGSGQFSDKRAGTFSNVNHHHEFHYTVPLRGMHMPASGVAEIDKRELATVTGMPDFKRFIVWAPTKTSDPPPRFCGSGKTRIADERTGKEISEARGLVPFVDTTTGGGDYPSLDKTVPEYDLCGTLAVFDTMKSTYYLRLEGADTNVKVTNRHNGFAIPQFNDRVYGQGGDFRSKLVFFDLPIKGGMKTVEGGRVYENFNEVKKSDTNNFPIQGSISWKITQE